MQVLVISCQSRIYIYPHGLNRVPSAQLLFHRAASNPHLYKLVSNLHGTHDTAHSLRVKLMHLYNLHCRCTHLYNVYLCVIHNSYDTRPDAHVHAPALSKRNEVALVSSTLPSFHNQFILETAMEVTKPSPSQCRK